MTKIDDILDLSKLELDSFTVNNDWFDLRKMLDEFVDILKIECDLKRLALRFMVCPDLPDQIFSDPKRLRQILLNLIGNAIKFTSHGTISLTIHFEVNIQEGG